MVVPFIGVEVELVPLRKNGERECLRRDFDYFRASRKGSVNFTYMNDNSIFDGADPRHSFIDKNGIRYYIEPDKNKAIDGIVEVVTPPTPIVSGFYDEVLYLLNKGISNVLDFYPDVDFSGYSMHISVSDFPREQFNDRMDFCDWTAYFLQAIGSTSLSRGTTIRKPDLGKDSPKGKLKSRLEMTMEFIRNPDNLELLLILIGEMRINPLPSTQFYNGKIIENKYPGLLDRSVTEIIDAINEYEIPSILEDPFSKTFRRDFDYSNDILKFPPIEGLGDGQEDFFSLLSDSRELPWFDFSMPLFYIYELYDILGILPEITDNTMREELKSRFLLSFNKRFREEKFKLLRDRGLAHEESLSEIDFQSFDIVRKSFFDFVERKSLKHQSGYLKNDTTYPRFFSQSPILNSRNPFSKKQWGETPTNPFGTIVRRHGKDISEMNWKYVKFRDGRVVTGLENILQLAA